MILFIFPKGGNKINILIICASLECGGAESHVVSLAVSLRRMGEGVTVASSGGALVRELEEGGVEHVLLSLAGREPVCLVRTYIELFRLIGKGDFDVVHSHTRLTSFIADGICKRFCVPMVTTIHAKFSPRGLYRPLSKWGILTVAVSEDLRDHLCREYGVAAENTRLIGNGIDTERFCPRPSATAPAHRIVFCSRMDEDCASVAMLLAELYQRIVDRFPDAEIFVCGGGNALPALEKRVENKDGFHLLGKVRRMEDVLCGADLFIGVSRAAMEAMACGVPVILAGDEGFLGLLKTESDLRAAAVGNFCGRGADKPCADKLFKAICQGFELFGSEENGEMLSNFVRKFYSAEKMAEQTAQVYREAIDISERLCRGSNGGRLLLCGYYGFGNIGDDALLRSAIELSEIRYSKRQIIAMVHRKRSAKRIFNVRCINRKNPISVAKATDGDTVLVFGGGTLLQDNTSLRSLLYYCSLIFYAEKRGARVELWGNGIGEPCGIISHRIMKNVLKKCSRVGVRDKYSFSLARDMLKDVAEPILERDLADKYPPSPKSRVDFLLSLLQLDGREYFVVAAKGGSGRGYLDILSEKIELLCHRGLTPLYIPMFESEDLKLSIELSRQLGGVVAKDISPCDAAGLIGGSRCVLGMRLHALIFASAASIPFEGLGGDPKIDAFCREKCE